MHPDDGLALGESGECVGSDAEVAGLGGGEQAELAIRQVADRAPPVSVDHAAIIAIGVVRGWHENSLPCWGVGLTGPSDGIRHAPTLRCESCETDARQFRKGVSFDEPTGPMLLVDLVDMAEVAEDDLEFGVGRHVVVMTAGVEHLG